MTDGFSDFVNGLLNREYNTVPLADAVVGVDRVLRERDRYRSAWLSARQGRANWRQIYLDLVVSSSDCRPWAAWVPRVLYNKNVRTVAAENRLAWERVHQLEDELSDLRLALSEAQGAQAREESAPEGVCKRCNGSAIDPERSESGGPSEPPYLVPCDACQFQVPDDVCGSEPPEGWTGDCWCTLGPGHEGKCLCTLCAQRHGAPGWEHDPDCCTPPSVFLR
jgi:hypothetical protein